MNLDAAFQWFMGDCYQPDTPPIIQVVSWFCIGAMILWAFYNILDLVATVLVWLWKKLKGRAAHV